MLFKAELGENNKIQNFDVPKQTNIFFPDDSTENLIPTDWDLESFIDNSGIEHVRIYKKSICTTPESEELWEIYLYDDEAMPLELYAQRLL